MFIVISYISIAHDLHVALYRAYAEHKQRRTCDKELTDNGNYRILFKASN